MARDPIFSLHAHLPEFPLEMLDMWLVHGSDAVLLDELDNAQESLSNVLRQVIELSLDPPVQEFDMPCHILNNISKKRCCRDRPSHALLAP